jgi:hypothetical protein
MPTDTQTRSDRRGPTDRPDPTGRHRSGGRRGRTGRLGPRHDDRGQATSEYGLVILVAAGIAFGVISWAGHTDAFTRLFDSVVRHLTSHM